MKAHVADQKAVLVFQEGDDGKGGATLFKFPATGRIDEIHQHRLEGVLNFIPSFPHQKAQRSTP